MVAKTPYPQHLAYKPQGYSRLSSLAKYPTAVLKEYRQTTFLHFIGCPAPAAQLLFVQLKQTETT
jgi:hypothetical protein